MITPRPRESQGERREGEGASPQRPSRRGLGSPLKPAGSRFREPEKKHKSTQEAVVKEQHAKIWGVVCSYPKSDIHLGGIDCIFLHNIEKKKHT